MKRLVLAILFLLVASDVWAAGSCVLSGGLFTDGGIKYSRDRHAKRVTYLCTHHTDNSLSATLAMAPLDGWYVYSIATKQAGTAPTDATDLNLDTAAGKVILDEAGNGLNLVDSSTYEWDYPEGQVGDGSDNSYVLLWDDDQITVSTANNAVASATFYLIFELVK